MLSSSLHFIQYEVVTRKYSARQASYMLEKKSTVLFGRAELIRWGRRAYLLGRRAFPRWDSLATKKMWVNTGLVLKKLCVLLCLHLGQYAFEPAGYPTSIQAIFAGRLRVYAFLRIVIPLEALTRLPPRAVYIAYLA